MAITRPSIDRPKYMPVKCIGDIELEQEALVFANGCSLDDGEILVLVPWTSPPANYSRQIPKNVSPARCQRGSTGIKECIAICWARSCAVRLENSYLFEATTIPATYKLHRAVYISDPLSTIGRYFL